MKNSKVHLDAFYIIKRLSLTSYGTRLYMTSPQMRSHCAGSSTEECTTVDAGQRLDGFDT